MNPLLPIETSLSPSLKSQEDLPFSPSLSETPSISGERFYRQSLETSLPLGTWPVSTERQVAVFLSSLGHIEAFVLSVSVEKETLEKNVNSVERILKITGISAEAFSAAQLASALQENAALWDAVLTGSPGSYAVNFIPRLNQESQDDTVLIEAKLLEIENNPQASGCVQLLEEIFQKAKGWKVGAYLSLWSSILRCFELVVKEHLEREGGKLPYTVCWKLSCLVVEKQQSDCYGEFLSMLGSFRAFLLSKEKPSKPIETLFNLAIEFCEQVKDLYPDILLQEMNLLLEAGTYFLKSSELEEDFTRYTQATYYYARAYRLTERHSFLHSWQKEAISRLLSVQGVYLKKNPRILEELFTYYKTKYSLDELLDLYPEEEESFLSELDEVAEFLAVRGCLQEAQDLYIQTLTALHEEFPIAEKWKNLVINTPTCETFPTIPEELLEKFKQSSLVLSSIQKEALTLIQNQELTLIKQKNLQDRYAQFFCDLLYPYVLILDPQKKHPFALLGIEGGDREIFPSEFVFLQQEATLAEVLQEHLLLEKKSPLKMANMLQWVKHLDLQTCGMENPKTFTGKIVQLLQDERYFLSFELPSSSLRSEVNLSDLWEEIGRRIFQAYSELHKRIEICNRTKQFIPPLPWRVQREKYAALQKIIAKVQVIQKEDNPSLKKVMQDSASFFTTLKELFHLQILAFSSGEKPLVFKEENEGLVLSPINPPLPFSTIPSSLVLRLENALEEKAFTSFKALKNPSFLMGRKELYEEYSPLLTHMLDKEDKTLRVKYTKALVEHCLSLDPGPFSAIVDKDAFVEKWLLLLTLSLDALALYYEIDKPGSSLEKVLFLAEKELISLSMQASLAEFFQIATSLRWHAYLETGREKERIQDVKIRKLDELLLEPWMGMLKEWQAVMQDTSAKEIRVIDFFADFYLKKVHKLLDAQEYSKALSYLEKALLIREEKKSLFLLGKLYLFYQEYQKAYQTWQKISFISLQMPPSEEALSQEEAYKLLTLAKQQIKTADILNRFFPEEREKTTTSLDDTSPEKLFSCLLETGKVPFLEEHLKVGLYLLVEKESRKEESLAKKSLGNQLTPLYFALPKSYQEELIKYLDTACHDRLFLLEQLLTEKGYLFAAKSREQKWHKETFPLLFAHPPEKTPFVEGINWGKGTLSSEVARALFEGKRFKNSLGKEESPSLQEAFGCRFKKNPPSPGDEYAVFVLSHLITGQGPFPLELLKIVVSYQEHLILVSEKGEGKLLPDLLTSQDQLLEHLDEKQFSQMLLMTLLLDPTDDRPENFLTCSFPLRLMRLDNSYIFVPSFVQRGLKALGKEELFLKTALFCFDKMQEEIHPAVKEAFLCLDPALVVESWLEALILYNQKVAALFSEDTIHAYWKEGVLIPFFIHPGTLLYLYEKMIRIRYFFSKGKKSHLELLQYLDPKLASVYKKMLGEPLSPQNRFALLARENQGSQATTSLPSIRQIKKYALKSSLEKMTHFKSFTPEEALKALKARLSPLPDKEWEIEGLSSFPLPFLEKKLQQVNWSEKPASTLSSLSGIGLHKLYLPAFLSLKDQHLTSFLSSYVHPITGSTPLHTLDLQGCAALTSKIIDSIQRHCPYLHKLKLKDTSIKSIKLSSQYTPYLKLVNLRRCAKLQSVKIELASLQTLIIEKCSTLKTLYLDCPLLSSFPLKDCNPAVSYTSSPQTPITPDLFASLLAWHEKDTGAFLLENSFIQDERILSILKQTLQKSTTLDTLLVDFSEQKEKKLWTLSQLDLKNIPQLSSLMLKGLQTADIVPIGRCFQETRALEKLDLQGEIEDEGIQLLSTLLPENLKYLSLDTSLKIHGIESLAKAVSRKKHPITLDLQNCLTLQGDIIHSLILCKNLEKLLLPYPLDQYRDSAKQTLLHWAIKAGNIPVVRSLLFSLRIEVESQDEDGITPWQLAFHQADKEMTSLVQAARKLENLTFGRKDWLRYFGEIGKEPPLPLDILHTLNTPCPIWSNRSVEDTHVLVLIPEKVNGRPLTLDYFRELIRNPQGNGLPIQYNAYYQEIQEEFGSIPSPASYWVLMTKDALPFTRTLLYKDALRAIKDRKKIVPAFKKANYRVPTTLEAAVCILTEYVRSGQTLYANNTLDNSNVWTYTFCQEVVSQLNLHVKIGGFGDLGPSILYGLEAARETNALALLRVIPS